MKDKKLENLIKKEIERQESSIDLIASENYASQDILDVLGSPLVNKYSEGYPGKRYYPGNEFYDQVEELAKERALKTFKLSPAEWSVNVQPYSGSPANLAIYSALMKPGDILMGMKLASGGHLTHGHKVNISGKIYKAVQYGVNEKTGLIDYEEIAKLAKEHKPKVIVSGLTAYPRKIDFKKFGDIAKLVGAYHVADISHIAGLIVAGVHPSPFEYCDVVMTTTHKTLRGPRGAIIFSRKSQIRNPKSQINSKLKIQNSKLTIAEAIDKAVFPGLQGGPHNNVTAAKALMFFEALQPKFKSYQKQIIKNAKILSESLKVLGFKLVTGGTDNHLMLVDLRNFKLDGLAAEILLEKNNIIANRNSIPGDISPFKPSGIRIGTPAVTTRGMKEKEMRMIADLIFRCLFDKENVKKEIKKICKKFPLKYRQ
jgi:glycine hydroxymethyltransferase